MAGQNTLTFSDSNFEQEVLQSSTPVLVDFWAEWCMPCRALGPVIDEIANDYAGKVKVGKLDTDSNQETSAKFGIQSIPTVLVFRNGEIVKRFSGLRPKKDLAAALDAII
ncbi:MAG: thioredoxin [Phycisphaerae bacterium]|nr:thioredoxin [Phycisphaerae bacterium]